MNGNVGAPTSDFYIFRTSVKFHRNPWIGDDTDHLMGLKMKIIRTLD